MLMVSWLIKMTRFDQSKSTRQKYAKTRDDKRTDQQWDEFKKLAKTRQRAKKSQKGAGY